MKPIKIFISNVQQKFAQERRQLCDYASNGSVQVMLFKDRLEVWNPGTLPIGLTVDKLTKPHHSLLTNPLLANPMYLAGSIERLGTGTRDIISMCKDVGLRTPEFVQDDIFKVVLWRKDEVLNPISDQVSDQVAKLISIFNGDMNRGELQDKLGISHNDYFRKNYLSPAIEDDYVELTIPDKPTSSKQKYRLTTKGKSLISKLDQ